MNAEEVRLRLADIRVLPVIVIDDAADAVLLARALAAGGIGCAEVTLRTPAAADAITAMSSVEDFLVGCGTALTPDGVTESVAAGARFIVSPGHSADVATRARAADVPYFPGIATATELMAATADGTDVVKLFPAALLGGAGAITALGGPFPHVRFIPSGGVSIEQAPEYRLDPVFSVSTSWIAPRRDIVARRWDAITDRAVRFVAAVTS